MRYPRNVIFREDILAAIDYAAWITAKEEIRAYA
jgi:hypothetical protein